MHIVGHCFVTEASGTVPPESIRGQGIFALMLPDYAQCHGWGYTHCWKPVPVTRENLDEHLMRAHLLADWFVHFGGDPRDQQRVGWAYRQMHIFAPLYAPFFSAAQRIGARVSGPPVVSRGDFAHSMVEYCVDVYLARRGDLDRSFEQVRAALGSVGARRGKGSMEWIRGMLAERNIESPDLAESVTTFREDCAAARDPEELTLRAGLRKLGLPSSEITLELMRTTVEHGLRRIDTDEVHASLAETAQFLRTWMPAGSAAR